MSIQIFSFVALRVRDLGRSRRFYVDGLGFLTLSHLLVEGRSPTAVELGLESLRTEGLFIERDGMRLQLQHQDLPPRHALPPPRPQAGLSHFGVRVDDLDAALRVIEAHGGTVVDGGRHSNPQVGSDVARVLDPDGVRIELLQMPGDPARLPGEPLVSK